MKPAPLCIGLTSVIAFWLFAVRAPAQMFGTRPGGGGLGQSAAKESTGVGTVNFNERFIRGNRRPGTFVGGDAKERKGFVGSLQGGQAGRSLPAISAIHSSAPDANRTAALRGRSRSSPYEPRLSVAFDVTPPPDLAVARDLNHLLTISPEFHSTGPIAVSVEGGIAILRGEVASERDRALAERLILFEPGIDSVRNELTVQGRRQGSSGYLPRTPSPPLPNSPQSPASAPR
jgi:hypothetical protein